MNYDAKKVNASQSVGTNQNIKVGDKVIVKPYFCDKYAITNEHMKAAEVIKINRERTYTNERRIDMEDYAQIKILDHTNKHYIGYTGNLPLKKLALVTSNKATKAQEKSVINIRPIGNKVTAIMSRDGSIISSASAICCPEDAFDYKLGTIIAFSRLFGEEKFFDIVKTYYKEFTEKWNEKMCKKFTTAAVNAIGTPVKKTLFKHQRKGFTDSSLFVGYIGEETKYRDTNGKKLCVGDVVDVFDRGLNKIIDSAVVYEQKEIPKTPSPLPVAYVISGIEEYCQANGNVKGYYIAKRGVVTNLHETTVPRYTNKSMSPINCWFTISCGKPTPLGVV